MQSLTDVVFRNHSVNVTGERRKSEIDEIHIRYYMIDDMDSIKEKHQRLGLGQLHRRMNVPKRLNEFHC